MAPRPAAADRAPVRRPAAPPAGPDSGWPGLPEVLAWYARAARDLPWRRPGVSPWGVLVSEVMLQQTPVARVAPAWQAWVQRWPTPAACAGSPAGDAVRQWGRLGYPRRALRLHAAAARCVTHHGGEVPAGLAQLRALPGCGDYTAAAVYAFAFAGHAPVVDVNVGRVVARAVQGQPQGPGAVGAADRARVAALLPGDGAAAARLSVALMELGALVCTARRPACPDCPLRTRCAWVAAGCPDPPAPRRPSPGYTGSDRQVRGLLLAVLRDADGPLPEGRLEGVWPDAAQRARALAGLLDDGLATRGPDGRVGLPG